MSTDNLFTDVRIWPTNHKTIKANGSVVVAGVVKVNFKVQEGSKGLWVTMPSHKSKDKEGKEQWYNDVFLVEEDHRKALQELAISEYNKKVSNPESAPAKKSSKSDGVPF